MLRSVGYSLVRNAKPTIPSAKGPSGRMETKMELNIKITSTYGYYSTFVLKSVSMNTSIRPRISVCLFDCGSNKHMLLVKGEEEHIVPSLEQHLNRFPKERALYKQLMGLYRKRGLKRVVLAARYMSENEAKTYIAAVRKASVSKRGDQQDELEKIARVYEKCMYFVGAVGLTDELRDDARFAIDLISRAKPNLFMLSGDSLDSCLTVAKKVNFCPGLDFEDSQGYYKISGGTEEKLSLQFRRILEDIGDMLTKHLASEKIGLNLESSKHSQAPKDQEDPRVYDEYRGSTNYTKRIERFKSHAGSLLQNREALSKILADVLNPFMSQREDSMKIRMKTLLIGGPSLQLILAARDPDLEAYLDIVLLFCNRIVGYSMKAAQKSKFVQIVHKHFPFTVAVGDGFNDIGMLNSSATGVQIETKSVPIIIANGVAKSLSDFGKYLVLSAYSNIRSGLYAANLAVWNFSLLGMSGAIRQSLGHSHGTSDTQKASILVTCVSIDLMLFYLYNPSPSVKMLELDPSISGEVGSIYRNALRYYVQMMMISILEGIIVAVYLEMN